jgi:hypothetical protein
VEESSSRDVKKTCKLLALITVCDAKNDWHWEREWRIVGKLEFEYDEIHCGLCPESEVYSFEKMYPQVKFISPSWNRDRILNKLVDK